MIFSPTLDPKDVPEFLKFKLPQEALDVNSEQNKNSTMKQYIIHIKRSIYSIETGLMNTMI